jgi:beta-galactosidase/beta-glucuronidase
MMNIHRYNDVIAVFALIFSAGLIHPQMLSAQSSQWSRADSPMNTPWTDEVGPDNALPEYPRPMMVREQWKNLNGVWDFEVTPKHQSAQDFNREILVPFPVESALSGVMEEVGAENRMWYRRTFTVDDLAEDERALLHFGAVDWHAHVYINGQLAGEHRGGYDPFSIDITDHLTDGGQEIVVTAWDPTDIGSQPVGKQSHDPRSIWYTAVSGIWQTVWLEYVPDSHITDLSITPDVDNSRITLTAATENTPEGYHIRATAYGDGELVGTSVGSHKNNVFIELENPRLWNPEDPFLYDLDVEILNEEGEIVDRVESYFGMRKITIGKDGDDYVRLLLNDEALFHIGPLDQGWWPDGLYTAPTDEALKHDIRVTKELGYNMIRKHVKVEPQRWYYWADKMGVVVWQDMPNGDMRPGEIQQPTQETARQFETEYKAVIDALYNHPSIVMWVPFNEGWGQYDTERITRWTQSYDPTRLVNNASGWIDKGVGHVKDVHDYPGPGMAETEDNRGVVLGEYGGEALVVDDHLWLNDFSRAPTHYETSRSESQLHQTYDRMMRELYDLKERGLAAAVYTQTTDVEAEVNGLMTYDRKVIKFDVPHMFDIHRTLIEK